MEEYSSFFWVSQNYSHSLIISIKFLVASFILEIFLVNGKGEPFAPQTTNIFLC